MGTESRRVATRIFFPILQTPNTRERDYKMKLLLLVSLLGLVFAKASLKITMNVFSGMQDPTWTVSDADSALVEMIFQTADPEYRPWPWYKLGYSGFQVEVTEFTGIGRPVIHTSHIIYGNSKLEQLLAQTAPRGLLPQSILSHMDQHLSARPLTAPPRGVDAETPKANPACVPPIRGPDNETVYDVSTDCCGWFVSHASQNNCYNYGTDVLTNTFAQPGRGTGKKWSHDTCADIRASAERDGLVWAGTTLPTEEPPIGHYVSLHIWNPDVNFHWVRKDTNLPTHWSHKPGGTPVRDVDAKGKKITDPSKADLSPWSEFCGYMIVVPSNITIN